MCFTEDLLKCHTFTLLFAQIHQVLIHLAFGYFLCIRRQYFLAALIFCLDARGVYEDIWFSILVGKPRSGDNFHKNIFLD